MRWSSVLTTAAVLLGALSVCGTGLAQESPGDGGLSGEQPRTVLQSLNQFSGIGASTGAFNLLTGDFGGDPKARPMLQGLFRYRFNDRWVGTGEGGFGWSAFDGQGDTVLTFTYGTLGVARRIGAAFGLDWRALAGAGIYRWHYKYKGKSLRDSNPVEGPDGLLVDDGTQRRYRALAPGGYLGAEAEYRLTRHVTLLGMTQLHYVFTADEEHYHYLFDQNHAFLGTRLGVVYHFSPYEGILWESKKDTRIRLESGREGR